MAGTFSSSTFSSDTFSTDVVAAAVGAARRGHRVRFQNHFTIGDKHYVFDSEYGLIRVLSELVQKANVPIAKKLKIKAEPVRVYEPDGVPIQSWDAIELPRVNMATADALIAQSVKFGQDEIVSAIEQMIRRRREEEEELLMLATFLH